MDKPKFKHRGTKRSAESFFSKHRLNSDYHNAVVDLLGEDPPDVEERFFYLVGQKVTEEKALFLSGVIESLGISSFSVPKFLYDLYNRFDCFIGTLALWNKLPKGFKDWSRVVDISNLTANSGNDKKYSLVEIYEHINNEFPSNFNDWGLILDDGYAAICRYVRDNNKFPPNFERDFSIVIDDKGNSLLHHLFQHKVIDFNPEHLGTYGKQLYNLFNKQGDTPAHIAVSQGYKLSFDKNWLGWGVKNGDGFTVAQLSSSVGNAPDFLSDLDVIAKNYINRSEVQSNINLFNRYFFSLDIENAFRVLNRFNKGDKFNILLSSVNNNKNKNIFFNEIQLNSIYNYTKDINFGLGKSFLHVLGIHGFVGKVNTGWFGWRLADNSNDTVAHCIARNGHDMNRIASDENLLLLKNDLKETVAHAAAKVGNLNFNVSQTVLNAVDRDDYTVSDYLNLNQPKKVEESKLTGEEIMDFLNEASKHYPVPDDPNVVNLDSDDINTEMADKLSSLYEEKPSVSKKDDGPDKGGFVFTDEDRERAEFASKIRTKEDLLEFKRRFVDKKSSRSYNRRLASLDIKKQHRIFSSIFSDAYIRLD